MLGAKVAAAWAHGGSARRRRGRWRAPGRGLEATGRSSSGPCAVDLRHPPRAMSGQLVAVREDARVWTGPWLSEPTPRPRGARPSGRPLSALLASTASNRSCIVTSRPACCRRLEHGLHDRPATSARWPRPIGTARRPPQRSSGWTRARGRSSSRRCFCPVEGAWAVPVLTAACNEAGKPTPKRALVTPVA